MNRPKISLGFAMFLSWLSACDNQAGPGGRSDGAAGMGRGATGGGAAGAGGASATVSVAGGVTGTATGGVTGTGGTTNLGMTANTGGTATTGGTAGASSTSAPPSAGGAGGAAGGSTIDGARTDAGTDTAAGGTAAPDAGTDALTAQDAASDSGVRLDAVADSASDSIANPCLCLGKPAPGCNPTGHLTYTLSQAAAPTADQTDAYKIITCAMDMAVSYYNCYADITGSVRVSYDTSVSTADGNINGSIRFGASRSYMQCATAMHEIAHTQGVGTAPKWPSLVSNGQFTGANANAQLNAINATLTKPLATVIGADTMHFWPYGLNYETEATGTDILVDHCEMVVAIRKDLGLQL